MNKTTVYVPVPVTERLPDYDNYVFWITESGAGFFEALDKDGNPWLYDMLVIHWLEPREGYFLTPEEMKERDKEIDQLKTLIEIAYHEGATNGKKRKNANNWNDFKRTHNL